uniref:Uncharacterized protein n=1 Tax=Chromera velia CCMP2878 TaxID=1169474 RepID=A0A0G4H9A1_9ALVE|eukprot:Cvel_25204.t1-p1 / transcript=Cvel_25204.t1 / gene=Cvel_25204 / organism=Chromera_velia_CCMP2878 / gene_product=hypothetical protein / transcript_product=hypothetical protein / location=Cvel_scaffold2823:22013-22861(+) / protein_length=283 / sequence_SO=supercontig / SO=protein_coding / is_pseudo=false
MGYLRHSLGDTMSGLVLRHRVSSFPETPEVIVVPSTFLKQLDHALQSGVWEPLAVPSHAPAAEMVFQEDRAERPEDAKPFVRELAAYCVRCIAYLSMGALALFQRSDGQVDRRDGWSRVCIQQALSLSETGPRPSPEGQRLDEAGTDTGGGIALLLDFLAPNFGDPSLDSVEKALEKFCEDCRSCGSWGDVNVRRLVESKRAAASVRDAQGLQHEPQETGSGTEADRAPWYSIEFEKRGNEEGGCTRWLKIHGETGEYFPEPPVAAVATEEERGGVRSRCEIM